MYENLIISNAVLVTLIVEFLLAVGIPIVVLVVWKKKTDVFLSPALMGAAAFVVFVMILEPILFYLVLGINKTVADFILSRPLLYAVFGGLAAGVLEETARFLVFKTMMRKNIGRENAITYGIGHGGIECITVLGVTMLSNFFLAVMFNNTGAEAFFAQYPPEDVSRVVESIHAINDIDFVSAVMAMVERIAAMVLHLELSVVVFAAVRMKKYWMYPLAILLHAGVDFLAGLYQAGVTGIWVMEALILACVAALAVPVYRLYKAMPTDKAPKLDKFGRDPRLGLI